MALPMNNKLGRLASNTNSSLLQSFVNYSCNFITLGTWSNVIKSFFGKLRRIHTNISVIFVMMCVIYANIDVIFASIGKIFTKVAQILAQITHVKF
jgi:hypothetical protein